MTVSSSQVRVSYTGDGTSVNFPIPFAFYLSTDILVLLGGAIISSGYSLSGGSGSTGTLTMTTAPLAGVNLQAILNVPLTQIVNLVDGTAFPSATLNQTNDRAIQAILRLQDQLGRSIHAPDGDAAPQMLLPVAALRASKSLMLDSNGNITTGVPNSQVITIDLLAPFLGLQRTAAEIAAGVTPVNYAYAAGNVLRYGADSTGVLTSVTAVQNAIKAALTGNNSAGIGDHGRVYFPRGIYKIDQDGVFNNPTTFQRGIIFEGDGLGSTQINLITGGSTKYLFNNPTLNTQQYLYCIWQHMLFNGDSTTLANGFKFEQDQGNRFFNCWFQTFNNCVESHGATQGSEIKFLQTKFTQIYGAVLLLDNQQALNIEFVQCDPETIYGDFIKVTSNGGGALRVFGGSWIGDDGGSPHYLLNIDGGGEGNNNNTFTFNGIQTEAHSVNNRLVKYGSGSGGAHIAFNNCNFAATNGAREQVNISTARVTFVRCVMPMTAGDTYTVSGPGGGAGDQFGEPGSIQFVECDIPNNFSTYMNVVADVGDGNVWGSASARGCFNNALAPGDPRTNRYAIDFDINWYNGGRASCFPGLKHISVKPQNRQWPFTDASWDWIVTLPNNALIKNIYIFRPANAGGAGAYTLQVGNGDKSTVYGTDGGGIAQNLARSIIIEKTIATLISAGTTNPNNQVRVWANPTSSDNVFGGYFVVEYY